jgi:hypothetical protein
MGADPNAIAPARNRPAGIGPRAVNPTRPGSGAGAGGDGKLLGGRLAPAVQGVLELLLVLLGQ